MKVIPLFKNESQLIARAAKDNRKAQEELYELYSPKMLSVCRMYLRDLQQAEDVMLTAFFKVFTHLADFRAEGSFEGWIRRIMIRECISFLRNRKDFIVRMEPSVEVQAMNNVESNIDVEHIQTLIDELPQGYRFVFVMYAIEGYKHREIAKMLSIDPGTSKSQLYKARQLLQEKINKLKTADYVRT